MIEKMEVNEKMCQLKDLFNESKRISKKIANETKNPVLQNQVGRKDCFARKKQSLALM